MQGKKNLFLLPDYGLIASLFIFFFLLINYTSAQEYSKLDSLKIGITYKVIMFDETEFIGKIIHHDSEYVIVSTELTEIKIRKNDIFDITGNLTPSKYRFLFSAGGGVSILTEGFFHQSYNRYSSLFSLQINAAFISSSSKGFRIDIGYSRFKKKADYYQWYNNYEGGDLSTR